MHGETVKFKKKVLINLFAFRNCCLSFKREET